MQTKLSTSTRREFITAVSILAGASVISALPANGFAQPGHADLTVQQVIDIILKDLDVATLPRSVDRLRAGVPDQQVTGIVTTTFPSIAVIKKAIKAGANMIISHEAAFYNNDDALARLKDDDIFKYKTDLLTKNKIAIWRLHDNWHARKPDGILWGTLLKLGWEKYYNPASPKMITLPAAVTLSSVVALTKKQLQAPQVRVIGDLKQSVKTIYLSLGAVPSAEQIPIIQSERPDLVLTGEAREWETCERVRDGVLMGLNTKLIALGHDISEEAGMEYAATWLAPKIAGVNVNYISSGTPFKYV